MPKRFSVGVHWDAQGPPLGPAPEPDGRPVFKSLTAYDGSPLEYSWNGTLQMASPTSATPERQSTTPRYGRSLIEP